MSSPILRIHQKLTIKCCDHCLDIRYKSLEITMSIEELSDKDYLLGLVGGGESGRTVNYIFLWVKFYIYRQRLFHDGLLDVYQWILELRDKLAIEKYINR